MTEGERMVQALSERELKDHGRNAIIAALSGIPVIGGPVSSLASEYIPNWKEERILNFIKELSEKLGGMEDIIDKEYIKTEEFAFLFEKTFLGVINNYQKEKLDAYKAILINSCIKTGFDTPEKEYFLFLVERLNVVHILILSLFWNIESFEIKYGVRTPEGIGTLKNTIMTLLEPFDFEKDLVSSAIRDLDNMGLLKGVHDALSTVMTASGATELKGRMSQFGKRFCEFVTLD